MRIVAYTATLFEIIKRYLDGIKGERMKKEMEKLTDTLTRLKSNPDYVRARVNLIPTAERMARQMLNEKRVDKGLETKESRPGADGVMYNHCFETMYFHRSMIKLANQQKLQEVYSPVEF